MKVFLAGETPLSKLASWKRDGVDIDPVQLESVIKRRLFSYYYHNDKGGSLDKEVRASIALGHELFLDSGAYSAFTKKETISVDQYGKFMLRQGHHFAVRANLDDIGDDGPKSWANLKALESMGCKPFPVFHYGDQYSYLTKMLDEGYPFMALGGLVGASTKMLMEWLDHVWANYLTNKDGTARTRVHGFGLTSFPLMFRYPWYSVDSSSWVMTSIFGSCVFVLDGKMTKIDFSDESPAKRDLDSWHYQAMSPAMKAKVNEILIPYGITAEQLGSHYSFRHVINAATFQNMEDIHNTVKFFQPQPTLFG
jgi:hypothetical protein